MGDLSQNFSRKEFACGCHCGHDTVDAELIKVLENLRLRFNKPIIINSGTRCANHNQDIDGAIRSQHLKGKACDFIIRDIHTNEVLSFLNSVYPNKYGIGFYKSWIHLDVRPVKKRW